MYKEVVRSSEIVEYFCLLPVFKFRILKIDQPDRLSPFLACAIQSHSQGNSDNVILL